MFHVVPLLPEEASALEHRVTLSDDRAQLLQPCRALGPDRCCGVYATRPGICRRFRCLALSGLEAGRFSQAEAQELIDDALARRRELAQAVGTADVHLAVVEARRDDDAGRATEQIADKLGRLRRALLILQLSPEDPILKGR